MLRSVLIKRVRAFMLIIGAVAGGLVVCSLLVDEGELVVLVTTDSETRRHETQLWTVEIDGRRYLRASSSKASWLERLRAEPFVVVAGGQGESSYLAVPQADPELLARVNQAMAEKYGLADRIWGVVSDRKRAVPIWLEPLPEEVVSEVTGRSEP